MIIDCFRLKNELDILDIRLAILEPYVDHFVVYDTGSNESKLKDKEKVTRVSSSDFFMNDLSLIHSHVEINVTDVIVYSKINEIPNLAKPNEVTESVLQNCAISFENLTFLKRFDRKCYELTDEGSELEKTSNRSIAFFHNILSKTKVKKIWNKMNTLPKYNSEKGWNLSEDDSLRSKNVDPEDYLPKHFLEKRDKFKRFL